MKYSIYKPSNFSVGYKEFQVNQNLMRRAAQKHKGFGKLCEESFVKKGGRVSRKISFEEAILASKKDFECEKSGLHFLGNSDELGISQITLDAVRHIHIFEWTLHSYGNPTVFIDTPELAKTLYNSRFSVHSDAIVLPNEKSVSYFAFPKGCIVDGVELRGCFFGTGVDDSDILRLKKNLSQYSENFDFNTFLCAEKRSYSLGLSSKTSSAYCVLWKSDVKECLDTEFEDNREGDELNIHFRRVHFRMCAAACIYAQAFPQFVKKGFPEFSKVKKKEMKERAHCVMTLHVPLSKDGGSKCMHIRNGHFRSLSHKKFKRNPDESIRIIFVKDSVINGTIDPTTVRASKER